jgi:hypothetical protein
LQLFTELKGKFDRESSEFSTGFKLKFMEGSVTGYMTSQMRFFATYMKALEGGAMQMEFNTQMDFKNANSKPKFGVNINMGMM